jgi:hypothetical protein
MKKLGNRNLKCRRVSFRYGTGIANKIAYDLKIMATGKRFKENIKINIF